MAIYKKITIFQGGGGTDDKKVKVSTDDAQPNFLEEKIVAGSNKVATSTANPGANEQFEIDVVEANIDHDALLNYEADEHAPLDDASTTTSSLWSSQKIQDELDTKVNKAGDTMTGILHMDNTYVQVTDADGDVILHPDYLDVYNQAGNRGATISKTQSYFGYYTGGINPYIEMNYDATTANIKIYDLVTNNPILPVNPEDLAVKLYVDTKVAKVSSTDNAITRFDGTSGNVQNSGVSIDDLNNVTGINDLIIDGNLTVNGTTTSVNSNTLEVVDANIVVNKDGTQATADAQDAGITVEMSDATDAKLGYDSSTSSKFVAGELGSESEVLTKDHVQDVLNKTIDATAATGTNSITMDSDDVLYDSTISGLFSNNVKDSIDELNERDLFNQYHLYEDNVLAYADAEQGVIDPTTQERDGWYYENVNAGEKINWYYFDGTTQGTVTLGEFSAYAIMTFDSANSTPIFGIYTFPTGTGDVFPGFAHSRAVYSEPASITPVVGQKYVVYFGQNPNVHPELPRIELSYSATNSLGDLNPLEPVLTVSFGSNSAEPVGDVKYMVQELGIYSDPVKHNVELRIKKAIAADFNSDFDTRLATKSTTDIAEGTNLYFTDERAQDAVGNSLVDSASIDLTYDDVANTITATVLPAGVDHDSLSGFVANEHIDHSSVEIQTAVDSGLSGGGDITSTRSLSVDITGTTAETSADDADEILIWDNSASARKKMTRANFLAGLPLESTGDINESSFSGASGAVAANVTGLAFPNGSVRSFNAQVSVVVDADSDLFEEFEIRGIQKGASWEITVESRGDDTNVDFNINNSGQVIYSSPTYAGFVSMDVRFRATVTGA